MIAVEVEAVGVEAAGESTAGAGEAGAERSILRTMSGGGICPGRLEMIR